VLATRFRIALTALALLTVPVAAQAPLDIRVALVIGNASYPAPGDLANPANDAAAMSEALRKLGFTVTLVRNGSRAEMEQAIAQVRDQLRGKSGVGIFYYAGHGMQLDWRNYMLPVEARPRSSDEVVAQAVPVDDVITAFRRAGNRINIVILDACRDNPFEDTATGKGLAQIDAPPGTFLAYATAPGNVAEDGRSSGNGLYTGYLLQELAKPATRIEDVFKRVRLQVRRNSGGRQIPWESTSLEDDFVFNDGLQRAAPAKPQRGAERDAVFALEKAEWDRIKDSRSADDFYAFLLKYPTGTISEAVQERLDVLNRPQVKAAPAKGRGKITRDLRVGEVLEFATRDYLTGLELRRDVLRVTAVRDGRVEFNDGQVVTTTSGAMIRNPIQISFDPPVQSAPAGDFQVGHKWTTRSVQSHPTNPRIRGWVEQDLKVVAYEPITVAAGTFQAYRIEAQVLNETGQRGTVTQWVAEDGVMLKTQRRVRTANNQVDAWDMELVRAQRCTGSATCPS
jgi:hypothetical protein